MSTVPNAMQTKIADPSWAPSGTQPVNVKLNSRVVAMTDNGESGISVQVEGQAPQTYAAVFNTTTMGCLQQMDLSGLNLPPGASLDQDPLTAIRTLGYDRATKVAIKFSQAWWIPTITLGGVSSTDLPISNVVYPSWNDETEPHVIIVSYSWAQDATRMASLMTPESSIGGKFPNDPIVQL